MQRKRHINFKYWRKTIVEPSTSTDSYSSIQNGFHSIPALSFNNTITNDDEMKNKKSNVLYSIPCVKPGAHFCGVKMCVFAAMSLMGILTLANSDWCSAVAPTASLSLGNPTMTSNATPGATATASTEVAVDVKNAEGYSLVISFDNVALTNGGTTINAGNAVDDNTWGYKWDTESTYTAPTADGRELVIPALVDGATNFTRVLSFAAKFADSATPGTYHAAGTLSLLATAKETTGWNDLVYMQDMTPEACAEAPSNEAKNLIDKRNDATYAVMKWADNRCWMTADLTLIDKKITPEDSNVTSDFTIPAASTTGFSAMSSMDGYAPKSYGSGTSRKYYNWYTATAGAGDASMNSGVVSTSICPKGWRLPTGGDEGEFEKLYVALGSPSLSDFAKAPYNFSGIKQVIDGSTANSAMYSGAWWSNTVFDASKAYVLSYSMMGPYPATSSARYYGNAVRCIADDGNPVVAPTTYTLKYDANGGSGVPTTQTVTSFNSSYTFTIPSTPQPTKSEWIFLGWDKTILTGNWPNPAYRPRDSIILDANESNVTLYATYCPEKLCAN